MDFTQAAGAVREDEGRALLRTALADDAAEFRDGQWGCIQALLQRRRLLVVQRTGWGKSMVYFLATRLLRDAGEGVTLLISPLLSLMRNQILAAKRIGIRAETINSTNQEDWQPIEEKLVRNEVDVLLISPERLANDRFRSDVLVPLAAGVGLFVVDEVHCISDWGHDFRPDYRRIVRVLDVLPGNIPVLATTATANDRVVKDVVAQLGDVEVVRGPLTRRSLRLQNIRLPSQAARMAWLAKTLSDLPGTGVVYCLTRRDADRVTGWLRQKGIDARTYHAGSEDREALEDLLLANRVKALVATVALGMGFDKPDLGFVIHYQRPGSVVHYYQQVGRAGRAVEEAFGILLSGDEDDDIIDYFIRAAFPPQGHVDAVLSALEKAVDGMSITMLEQCLNLSRGQIEKTLKYLSVEFPSPVDKQRGRWHALPVNYELNQENIEALCTLRRAEQQEMREYMKTGECLMEFLSRALDDPGAQRCGRCASCLDAPLVPESFDMETAREASLYLKHCHLLLRPRKRWPGGAFPEYGFQGNIATDEVAEEGRALCGWGDAGWGGAVRDGKYRDGRFSDELIDGCLRMIRTWAPDPTPTWATCVPSLTREDLVPDFAARLAAELDIPFAPVVGKARVNRPQKEMQNSFQQAGNLDGVFTVDPDGMLPGPVLLIDDMVDSRWTFTVVAALLRNAGCPAVFPMALAVGGYEEG